jgi:hypothetical protein
LCGKGADVGLSLQGSAYLSRRSVPCLRAEE